MLDAGRLITGRVITPEGIEATSLWVAFVPDRQGQEPDRPWYRGGRREEVEPDGSFRFERLQAETGQLQVLSRSTSMVLLRIPGVSTRLASEPEDLRLEPLDLRGIIELLELSFVDPAGASVPDARFAMTLPGVDEKWWSQAKKGEATVIVPPGGCDLEINTKGFRQTTVEGVQGRRTIQLEPAIPIRIKLRPATLASEYSLELRVNRVESGPEVTPNRKRLDADGTFTGRAPAPGEIRVYVRVRWRDAEGSSHSSFVRFGDNQRHLVFDVADSPSEQLFHVDISRAAVEAAMASGR